MSTNNTQFRDEAVTAMNTYRQLHQVEPLTHSGQLDEIAQSWADHLAKTGSLGHNPNASYKGENLGENCAMKWTSDRQDFTGQQCVDQWYSEVERYDFQRNSGPSTGHFTQVVWKSSREVGLGRAQTKDGKWLVCANFYPAGNYNGENAENVYPTRDGKFVLPPIDDLKAHKSDGCSHGNGNHDNGHISKPTTASSRGESVKREVQTKTVGSGANAVTTKITTETRTGPDGKTHVTTTEEIIKGGGNSDNKQHSDKSKSFGSNDDDDFFDRKFKSFGSNDDDDFFDKKFKSVGVSKDDDEDDEETAPVTQTPEEFIKDVVHWHNVYRAKHQAADIVENKELTELAQKWAEHLAQSGVLQHSRDKYRDQPIGENVAAKSSSRRTDYTGQNAVDQWYKESPKFDYQRPENSSGTGHFSQVVWKSSTEIGVGRATSSDGRQAFVVCNYFPAGNYRGDYAQNVLPPK